MLKSKNRSSRRLWIFVFALIGLVLTAVLYFPAYTVIELSRMKRELGEMNQVFWDAVIEGDFTAASQHLALIGHHDSTDDELAELAAEWAERAQALHDSGVSVVRVEMTSYRNMDFCPISDWEIVVNDNGREQSYPQMVSSSPKCGGAGFNWLWIPHVPASRHNRFGTDDESERMQEIRLVFSSMWEAR